MTRFLFFSLMLCFCVGAFCLPPANSAALICNKTVNLLCAFWWFQGLMDQLKGRNDK